MKHYDTTIYLLKIVTPDGCLYKIGNTKGDVYNRVKSLQTGCPYEINVAHTFKTSFGQILERTMHNTYSIKKTYGEWFALDMVDEAEFIETCLKYEKIHEKLEKIKGENVNF